MSLDRTFFALVIAGILSILGNTLGHGMPVFQAAWGYCILVALLFVGVWLSRLLRWPMVVGVSLLAVASTSAISPVADMVRHYTDSVQFLAIATPVLAYAGLAIGKDWAAFHKLSWRIVVVALTVFTGTFLCATILAQWMLHLEGVV